MTPVSPERGPRQRRLQIVSFEQFGYHIDTFQYCRHLRDRYIVTYVCLDDGLPYKELSGIDVRYCRRRPFGKRELGLLVDASAAVNLLAPDLVFLRRTKFSFLLRLWHPRTPMVFDVRSGSVEEDPRKRYVENMILRFNSWFFSHITVISIGLRRQLLLPRRAKILPLAAEPQPRPTSAPGGELRLVYIGTFKNRHLERTVDGLGRFLAARDPVMKIHYTIIGFGSQDELAAVRDAIRNHDLGKVVELRERIEHASVPAILAQHNVGVAFTPQVPWFEHQPSTKIYEYLHSGLLCIATDSAANRELITPDRGVLVADTAEDFARGLDRVLELLPRWNPETVAATICDRTWERVVNDILEPMLNEVRR